MNDELWIISSNFGGLIYVLWLLLIIIKYWE